MTLIDKSLKIIVLNNINLCTKCQSFEKNDNNLIFCKSSSCCKNKLNSLTKDCPVGKWKSPKTILEEKHKHLKDLIYNMR